MAREGEKWPSFLFPFIDPAWSSSITRPSGSAARAASTPGGHRTEGPSSLPGPGTRRERWDVIRSVGRSFLAVLAASVAAGCGSSTDSSSLSTGDSTPASATACTAEIAPASEAPDATAPGTTPDTEPAAACSAEIAPASEAPDTTAPGTTPDTEPAAACSAEIAPAGEAPDTTAPGATPGTEPAAACSTEAILPVLQSLFPDNDMWNIVDVEIADCRNGYARVFAVPDVSSCADPDVPCLESEQVYLRDDGGAWVYVDSGTGVECANPEGLLPETLEACEALGLLP